MKKFLFDAALYFLILSGAMFIMSLLFGIHGNVFIRAIMACGIAYFRPSKFTY
jgi:hypothetical protein